MALDRLFADMKVVGSNQAVAVASNSGEDAAAGLGCGSEGVAVGSVPASVAYF